MLKMNIFRAKQNKLNFNQFLYFNSNYSILLIFISTEDLDCLFEEKNYKVLYNNEFNF